MPLQLRTRFHNWRVREIFISIFIRRYFHPFLLSSFSSLSLLLSLINMFSQDLVNIKGGVSVGMQFSLSLALIISLVLKIILFIISDAGNSNEAGLTPRVSLSFYFIFSPI